MDYKKRISRKSNLHSRFEAKESGAWAVMKVSKTPNVPLVPSLNWSISLSSFLGLLEKGIFNNKQRFAYQPFLFSF